MYNSTLMPGFDIKLSIRNTRCNVTKAMQAFIDLQPKPDAILGYSCSPVALALQPTASAMRIPIVGVDVNSGLLSSKERFMRLSYSLDAAGQLAAAIARFIHLKYGSLSGLPCIS